MRARRVSHPRPRLSRGAFLKLARLLPALVLLPRGCKPAPKAAGYGRGRYGKGKFG